MKEKQIRVLRVKPNAKPLPDDIDNTLEADYGYNTAIGRAYPLEFRAIEGLPPKKD